MRRPALLLFLLPALALLGCGDSGTSGGPPGLSGSIAGTWVVDIDATLPAMLKVQKEQMAQLPEEQRKMAEPMLAQMTEQMKDSMGKMKFVVNADGTFSGTIGGTGEKEETGTGTWKQVEGGYEFAITKENGKDVQPGSEKAKPVRMTVQGKHLRFAPSAEQADVGILLKRQ